MRTQIISSENLNPAISFLKKGIPLAFPTETVYGLGAPVFLPEAIQRIFEIKGRPSDNPLIVHIASFDQAHLLSDDLPLSFSLLAEKFWPGPLTLIVRKNPSVPEIVSSGHPTIAIRMPVHAVARRLIEGVGMPVAAPSANLSGRPSPTSATDVLEDLDGKIPLIVDGGQCAIGIESAVLSLIDRPTLLRPGSIAKADLEEVLNEKIELAAPESPVLSPGMKYRHYAPKARIHLVFDAEDMKGPYRVTRINSRNLYAVLRRADRLGIPEIEIFCDRATQSNPALMNRLLRASGQI